MSEVFSVHGDDSRFRRRYIVTGAVSASQANREVVQQLRDDGDPPRWMDDLVLVRLSADADESIEGTFIVTAHYERREDLPAGDIGFNALDESPLAAVAQSRECTCKFLLHGHEAGCPFAEGGA